MPVIEVPLTAREREVAELAGLGYSARRVANDLHLSDRTVETHLRRVYGKLAIRCRDELIDFMRPVGREGVTK